MFFYSPLIVVIQYYDAEVVSEYVIRGNTAILKCNIPSFVADFVFVDAWIRTDGLEYTATNDFGICDRIFLEYVIVCVTYCEKNPC